MVSNITDQMIPKIKQAIETVFLNTIQQRCIVHMIINSVKFVSIYTSTNEQEGYEMLQQVKENGVTNILLHLKHGKKIGTQYVHSSNFQAK